MMAIGHGNSGGGAMSPSQTLIVLLLGGLMGLLGQGSRAVVGLKSRSKKMLSWMSPVVIP